MRPKTSSISRSLDNSTSKTVINENNKVDKFGIDRSSKIGLNLKNIRDFITFLILERSSISISKTKLAYI